MFCHLSITHLHLNPLSWQDMMHNTLIFLIMSMSHHFKVVLGFCINEDLSTLTSWTVLNQVYLNNTLMQHSTRLHHDTKLVVPCPISYNSQTLPRLSHHSFAYSVVIKYLSINHGFTCGTYNHFHSSICKMQLNVLVSLLELSVV